MEFVTDLALEVAHGDNDPSKEIVGVALCNNCASLTIGETTVHIPWTVMAEWFVKLAEDVQC